MTANASLELTRFRADGLSLKFDSQSNKQVLARVAACTEPDGYERAYRRWLDDIHRLPGTVLAATFQVEPDGRLAVGIGAANVLEASIEMNRLWGMPIIPGSGLKGLARHYANTVLLPKQQIDPDQFADLFGTVEASSYLTWLDAWYVPDAETLPFELDVVTVHHRSWNQDPSKPPSDFEDPVPSSSSTARGSYLVAVQAPDEGWAVAGMTVLQLALEEWGIGAKTGSVGYGRLRLQSWASQWKNDRDAEERAARQADDAERKQAEALQGLIDEVDDASIAANNVMQRWCEIWSSATIDPELRTDLGRQMLTRLSMDRPNYNRITGRVLANQELKFSKPKTYIVPLLTWMDEHAPGEFPL